MSTAQALGKYEIRGTLGKGAMGTVYDGWDPAIARRVAIKTVALPADPDPDTAEAIARFRREAQAAGRLTHPNIVAVYDYGETGDLAYIVMEFVDGQTLKAPLDKHERFALADIQRIMDDLLAGLQFSHDRGVVHRDIKPANIIMTSDGRAKIADFGIARIEMSSMTQAGTMLGTPSYMSPEQFMGQVVDRQTDVYSAGVVFYQLLTGERPFEGGMTAIMHKVLNTEPPVPSQLAVTVPRALDAVVLRAMAKRPDDRYPSAAAFAQAIRAALAAAPDDAEATIIGRSTARAATRPSPPPPARSRAPLLAGVAVVAALVLGAGGWVLFSATGPAPAPQASSDRPAETPVAALPPAPVPQAAPPAAAVPQAVLPPPAAITPASIPSPAPAIPQVAPASTPAQPAPPAQAAQVPAPAPPPATMAPPPQPAPPAAIQQATNGVGALRQQVAQALAQARCSLASGVVQDSGAVSVAGVAGASTEAALRQQLSGIAPLDWRVQPIDPVFCDALTALRPIAAQAGAPISGLALALAGGRTALHDGERIMPRVTMADFGGEMRVDYVGHDGSIVHLYPTLADPSQQVAAQPARRLAPGEVLSLGDAGGNRPVWEVGPPYGTDMIIAVAATAPLLAHAPAANAEDSATAYLRNLADGIDQVRRAGGRVSGTLLLVDTLAK